MTKAKITGPFQAQDGAWLATIRRGAVVEHVTLVRKSDGHQVDAPAKAAKALAALR